MCWDRLIQAEDPAGSNKQLSKPDHQPQADLDALLLKLVQSPVEQ